MNDAEIISVLQKAVTAAVAASTMPALPVCYVDIDFTPPTDQKYLEIVHIPNNRNDFYGSEKNYAGMLRLVLHWPKGKVGVQPPLTVLNSVCSYFTKDRYLDGGVKIVSEPDYMGSVAQPAENLYPASARYSCFRQ